METLIHRCAGLDVHKKTVEACVRLVQPNGKMSETVRGFETMTADLEGLSQWLKSQGVTHVAMESTGVYWKPIFNILEEDFTVLLCNARHIKNVPGRKTDVQDCQWIAQLLQHGLLTGSFIPPRRQRDLRDLTRHRAQLTTEKTRVVNRIQKTLEDTNIKLASVATDPLGVSGRLMIEALIDGERDPAKLADLARGRLKTKIPELKRALKGHFTEHHRFVLRKLMRHLAFVEETIDEFDERIEQQVTLVDLSPTQAPDRPESTPSAERPDDTQEQPDEPPLPPPLSFSEAIQLLDPVPGIDIVSVQAVLAEIGTDMSHFPTHKHLGSWSRICPGNNESAGKRKSGRTGKANRWLRRVLVQCAWAAARTKDSYFGAHFRQIAKRRGKKRACIAVAHSLLTVVYHILKYQKPYEDLGADFFDKIDPARKTRYHVKRLEELGHAVSLKPLNEAA